MATILIILAASSMTFIKKHKIICPGGELIITCIDMMLPVRKNIKTCLSSEQISWDSEMYLYYFMLCSSMIAWNLHTNYEELLIPSGYLRSSLLWITNLLQIQDREKNNFHFRSLYIHSETSKIKKKRRTFN